MANHRLPRAGCQRPLQLQRRHRHLQFQLLILAGFLNSRFLYREIPEASSKTIKQLLLHQRLFCRFPPLRDLRVLLCKFSSLFGADSWLFRLTHFGISSPNEISARGCAPRNQADANKDRPAWWRYRFPIWRPAPGLGSNPQLPNFGVVDPHYEHR